VSFRLLDWNDALEEDANRDSSIQDLLSGADVIIGADLVYDISIIPALAAVIALFLRLKKETGSPSKEIACVYLTLTIRRAKTISEFKNILASHSLIPTEVDLSAMDHKQFLRGQQDAGCSIILYHIYYP